MNDIYTQGQINELSLSVAEKIRDGGLICLFGDLGTGKTTFTKALAKNLGVEDSKVKSPTYTYIREYENGETKIFHIDLYRIEEMDELLLQEIKELIENKKNIVIVEWADKMQLHTSKDRIDIHFEYVDADKRKITISND